MFPHGAVELENNDGKIFKVNGQWIKLYLVNVENVQQVIDVFILMKSE